MNASTGILAASWLLSTGIEMLPHTSTGSMVDDRIQVDEARRGSREAIGALVERYSPGLYRYLIRLSGDPVLAQDLLQDTWLRVMERLDGYRPGLPFRNWLFAVARNRAFDVLRQQSRRLQHERAGKAELPQDYAEEVPDPHPSILEQLAEADLARCAAKAMESLPVLFREVLALRFEQGLEIGAIARILGLSDSAVKDRLYRGLDQLRLQMERLARHE